MSDLIIPYLEQLAHYDALVIVWDILFKLSVYWFASYSVAFVIAGLCGFCTPWDRKGRIIIAGGVFCLVLMIVCLSVWSRCLDARTEFLKSW